MKIPYVIVVTADFADLECEASAKSVAAENSSNEVLLLDESWKVV